TLGFRVDLETPLGVPAGAGQTAGEEVDVELAVALRVDLRTELALALDLALVLALDDVIRSGLGGGREDVRLLRRIFLLVDGGADGCGQTQERHEHGAEGVVHKMPHE